MRLLHKISSPPQFRGSPPAPILGSKRWRGLFCLFRLPRIGAGGLLLCILLSCIGPVKAAPPLKTPSASAIPDYGGRESAPVAVGDAAPNPLAQMGRAAEALVIVLAGVVGVVYALKRFGLVTPGANGKPGRIALNNLSRVRAAQASSGSPVTILSSQSLPGGAMLHLVSVAGRNLLLGVTPQSVSALTEWPAAEETGDEAASFDEYLSRADVTRSGGGLPPPMPACAH